MRNRDKPAYPLPVNTIDHMEGLTKREAAAICCHAGRA